MTEKGNKDMHDKTAYQETSFKTSHLKKFSNKVLADDTCTDLRLFTGANFLLANQSFTNTLVFYDYVKKQKPHDHVTPRYIEEINDRYFRLSQGMFGSNGCIFMFLWVLGLFGGGGVVIMMFFLAIFIEMPTTISAFFQTMLNCGMPLWLGLTFSLIAIGKIGTHRTKDRCGYEFHRDTGKICIRNVEGEIASERDFKDFMPIASTDHVTTGGYEVNTNLISTKDNFSVNICKGDGFEQGVLAWNYILTFMDVTKPLPDIPEHEPTRHLDPVTKAYDEKTGRDPYYWRKKKVEEVREMQKEELLKAQAWINKRKEKLRKKGFEDIKFLNSLLPA